MKVDRKPTAKERWKLISEPLASADQFERGCYLLSICVSEIESPEEAAELDFDVHDRLLLEALRMVNGDEQKAEAKKNSSTTKRAG